MYKVQFSIQWGFLGLLNQISWDVLILLNDYKFLLKFEYQTFCNYVRGSIHHQRWVVLTAQAFLYLFIFRSNSIVCIMMLYVSLYVQYYCTEFHNFLLYPLLKSTYMYIFWKNVFYRIVKMAWFHYVRGFQSKLKF